MRIPVYSLRTGILSNLIFLIISAMLLINVVMVKFQERDLIQARVDTGRLLIHALGQNAGRFLLKKSKKPRRIGSDYQFKRNVAQLIASGGFSEAVIINPVGEQVFTTDSAGGKEDPFLSFARKSLKMGIWSVNFSERTWGVIWFSNKNISISAPLLFEGRTLGAVTISASLMPIYKTLRKSEKVILLYILLDTIILAIVGIYLLSLIVVKPVNRLLQMTKEYKEGDIFPALGEASGNEIGNLSRSLSIMLNRLDENKRELKAHISSLEKANKELQQAQNEIVRSEKLASIGRLSAGIAHEIGNPIGIILGYLELIRKGDPGENEKEDFLNRIESEIIRINQIIRNLLDFSRPSSGKPEKASAHDLITNTVNILKPQPMMKDIRINLELKADNDTILADANQLQQVFLNIIMNAADAFTEKNLPEDKGSGRELILKSENSGSSIYISFMDNGPGISETELAHIFDPFYTTKEPGKGTGLGLSICYRILEELGGTIKAESSQGEGTTIAITLPLYGTGKEE